MMQVDYSALLRAMTSPFVAKHWRPRLQKEKSAIGFCAPEFDLAGVAVESVSHVY